MSESVHSSDMIEDTDFAAEALLQRPLPTPALARWQPLRIGLVDLYYYDSEEFWFSGGHLLLRGNNGTGKSKVLSLTMPFLLDAQLKPSRVEPDGDPGKRMGWNLLMGAMDRRIGYSWVEFGRLGEDGAPRYLTLGAGMSAAAARTQVDSWFFTLEGVGEDAPRLNQDLWLMTSERVVLTKERLRESLQGRGHIYETAQAYRRAVDERLFRLGQARYDALIDTLIQLRQPQLSKKPDESLLSNALSEALPPIAPELLADVADALGQLEDDRRQLEEYESLLKAVSQFEKRYRTYAGTQSRRQSRALRQAQTEFDNASRSRAEAVKNSEQALEAERLCQEEEKTAETALSKARAAHETLMSDPAMRDANRLDQAKQDAEKWANEAGNARSALAAAQAQLAKERAQTERLRSRASQAEQSLATKRGDCASAAQDAGLGFRFEANGLTTFESEQLVGLAPKAFDQLESGLRSMVKERRDAVRTVLARLTEVERLEQAQIQRQQLRDDAKDAADDAVERRGEADAKLESEGQALLEAWVNHFSSLRELRPAGTHALTLLTDWVVAPKGEDNPAVVALRDAQQETARRMAATRAGLNTDLREVQATQQELTTERSRLLAGEDAVPAIPPTRAPDAREGRPGSPLWQLIDFHQRVGEVERAGLEAAMEASGLLDAWVSPSGEIELKRGDGELLDAQVLARHTGEPSLAEWLAPAVAADCVVPPEIVSRLLVGIACTEADAGTSESWLSPFGRFRLGALSGAWKKQAAEFIGFSARAAARARRLSEIEAALNDLSDKLDDLHRRFQALEDAESRASQEWQSAPSDSPLRQANVEALGAAKAAREALAKVEPTEAALREAQNNLDAGRRRLVQDAGDLSLPFTRGELEQVGTALDTFNDAQVRLVQAGRELRHAWPDYQVQLDREQDATEAVASAEQRASAANGEAVTAGARFDTLRASIGMAVDELKQKLADAREAVRQGEDGVRRATEASRKAGEARAVASKSAETAEDVWQVRSTDRTNAVASLQRFAASGMFSAGVPELELPDQLVPWTIEPALTVARRAEQLLSNVADDDDAWSRIQKHIGEDLSELQRALSALNYQSAAEQTDFGQVVYIVYQNKQESPGRLAVRLEAEVRDRQELLTASEREVLENHLQAEIAAEVQRLLRAADEHVNDINEELKKRPTSTGVRFRLRWLPLPEQEGAPVGLDAARERLLNQSSDLWTQDDRRVVGAMLQQRIAAERERAESGAVTDLSRGLAEQLARALDYRRWHHFKIERWQGGQWRKLTGPASSGERALGLTVPLFAAVASFYGQASDATAPRLILLDEAFAGIDDAARAHCMSLIREFDLDFIITSEREWACYAELPGVSICQLQRKEGVDAVHVSRWTWDGKAKRPERDPNRRFAPRP
jgi:uncharacterized protein (TIGR02680 family)